MLSSFQISELGADDAFGAGYGAMIDDFSVQEAWNYDQEITASYHVLVWEFRK